ncbi:MAG: cytochrome c biogenesis protein ResB, partial [Planctomycetota bacterium]
AVMWSALALIILLIYLSVYGAFIGAGRAQRLVNTLPLTVYWLAFVVILIAGLVVFRRLVRVPALALIHFGCVLILAGGMWGSDTGHKLQKELFGIDKIRTGQMVIYEGDLENLITLENKRQAKLPFSVKLKDFRIEYYKPEYLWVQTREGQSWKIPVEIGSEFSLGADFGTVKILKVFENFKITIDGDKTIANDDPGPGSNPAIEVELKSPDGVVDTRYVFERFPGHSHPEDRLLLSYYRVISDYISELQIIENDKVVVEKDIEVNHPLHFGGYHFYQSSYDAEANQYTVLEVVSDSGLILVYGGYLMLCIGVFWHLWLRRLSSAGAKLKSE